MPPRIGHLISAVFDLSLAAVFLLTWTRPGGEFAQPVDLLLLIMLIEFITVHSTAMLGSVWMSDKSTRNRLRSVGGLTLMYAMFVGAWSAGFSTWAPFIGFWLLTANRLLGMLLDSRPDEATRLDAERSWARSVALYVIGGGFATFLPVPRLGLTPEAMTAIHIPGSGLWVDEPWRVLAFGLFYFGLAGASLVRDVVRGPVAKTPSPKASAVEKAD